ncbi:type II toxin-antitoxin system HicA family toxin [Rhodococcoides fascians]|uniref:type II toxin-antitoxin system HicA family toxin n=1 Tax=Rhodococcoides fascians TaxID=1828 RepID=UPI003522D5E1
MGRGRFPSVKIAILLKVLERHCGPPVRTTGSHHFFKRPDGKRVMIAVHAKEMWGTHVRALLVTDLGLSEEEALEEVGSR